MDPLAALAALHAYSDPLAWLSVALFLGVTVLFAVDETWARRLGAVAWTVFGVFWASVFPYFFGVMHSGIESALSLLAVPASVYAGYLLLRGRSSMLVLTRAVGLMGLVYLPAETVPVVRRTLIETVAAQTSWLVGALGYPHDLVAGPVYGYRSQLVFHDGAQTFVTYIEIACTGIGSMAIFAGLIAAVRAPLRRKVRGLAVAVAVIYALNVVRNVFIAVAFGDQWFQVFVPQVMALVGYDRPGLVSFFIADRVISQFASVVALVGIAYLVAREVPELLDLAEELLYALTGREIDLGGPGRGGSGGAGGSPPSRPVRADGDGRP
ncbi:MAG: archaeosortase A [Halobacteriaceae archaeon]